MACVFLRRVAPTSRRRSGQRSEKKASWVSPLPSPPPPLSSPDPPPPPHGQALTMSRGASGRLRGSGSEPLLVLPHGSPRKALRRPSAPPPRCLRASSLCVASVTLTLSIAPQPAPPPPRSNDECHDVVVDTTPWSGAVGRIFARSVPSSTHDYRWKRGGGAGQTLLSMIPQFNCSRLHCATPLSEATLLHSRTPTGSVSKRRSISVWPQKGIPPPRPAKRRSFGK